MQQSDAGQLVTWVMSAVNSGVSPLVKVANDSGACVHWHSLPTQVVLPCASFDWTGKLKQVVPPGPAPPPSSEVQATFGIGPQVPSFEH